MVRILRAVLLLIAANAPGLLASGSLLAVAIGLWWERPSLALIVPGAVVFGLMAWARAREGR